MLESALFFETPAEIYRRVYSQMKPRSDVPAVTVEFCGFASANSFIRMESGRVAVRITDVLEDAPAPVLEALANILLSKLLRRRVPADYSARYRRYLNRRDVRRRLEEMRQERGRKLISGSRGAAYDLEAVFDDMNFKYFHGLMARPMLGWSRRVARGTLGHYDAPHNAIVISKLLDRPEVPRLAVEYVMYHEMLHVRHPVEHSGARRCVHTAEFKAAERQFDGLAEAKALLKAL